MSEKNSFRTLEFLETPKVSHGWILYADHKDGDRQIIETNTDLGLMDAIQMVVSRDDLVVFEVERV